ncbi:hypothetical protein Bca4012_011394 [Brassica carinata]
MSSSFDLSYAIWELVRLATVFSSLLRGGRSSFLLGGLQFLTRSALLSLKDVWGEALNGWLLRKADSFEKIEKTPLAKCFRQSEVADQRHQMALPMILSTLQSRPSMKHEQTISEWSERPLPEEKRETELYTRQFRSEPARNGLLSLILLDLRPQTCTIMTCTPPPKSKRNQRWCWDVSVTKRGTLTANG